MAKSTTTIITRHEIILKGDGVTLMCVLDEKGQVVGSASIGDSEDTIHCEFQQLVDFVNTVQAARGKLPTL